VRRRLGLRRRAVPAVAVVAAIAFVNSAAWALIVPNFQAPDEPSHVGYAVELAETGHPPRDDWARPFASSEVGALAGWQSTFDILQFASVTRPPWSDAQQRAYERVAATNLPRKDGGGPTTASIHGPVYYAFPALGYRIFYWASLRDRMLAMRLASALLAALTVAFVFGTVRELLPRHPWAAPAAALLVAFQPMFSFMGGVVNADVGVNAAGAALIYLLVRALRRGLTPGLAAAIPAAFVLGVLAKATMFAFVPVLLFALGVLLWRRAGGLREWGAMAGTFVALVAIWAVVAPAYHHRFIPVPGGPSGGTPGLNAKLSYIWQIFLPRLPFMHDDFGPSVHPFWSLYIVRAWGGFGWLDVSLPNAVFHGLAVFMGVMAALVLYALWVKRDAVKAHWPELVVLVGAFVCVAGFSHAAFARFDPNAAIQEQGRYLFPAITVPAAAAMVACVGLGRRFAAIGGVALVTGMMLLCGYAQLYVFSAYFT
jgi:4-amino-4-deoxy-L-arabinose transferase-like glycosyltransferase